jgi:hypothetical protein
VPDREHSHPRHDLVTDRREPERVERVDATFAERLDRRAPRHRTLQEKQADDRGDTRLRQAPLVCGRVLLGAGGSVFAEQVVDCRFRVADAAERVAEGLGGSRIRSGKVDDGQDVNS